MKFNVEKITAMAKNLYQEERNIKRLDGWFLAQEIKMKNEAKLKKDSNAVKNAKNLVEIIKKIPLYVSDNNLFVGTQRDAFAMTYALINPSFRVETFEGYCDLTAVFNDIQPNEEFTNERIKIVKDWFASTDFATEIAKVYSQYEDYTGEVAFFFEQVTGHTICDFELALDKGINYIISLLRDKIANCNINEKQKDTYQAMIITLEAVNILSDRYLKILLERKLLENNNPILNKMVETLQNVPANGCNDLFEAMQVYILLWQVMCLEQLPNPYAFSVGNCDRFFEKYYRKSNYSREEAAALFKHFLVFFNIGTRSWAISQNILISGKDNAGNDLTNDLSFALLDAYYDMNLPQPILSVKLHQNTPAKLYKELGKFFFTPGCLTPSLFNDDSLFKVLEKHNIEKEDISNYAIAGCQEPLIMGKDSGNTTNSWLNLGKILELTLNDGHSLITNKKMGPSIKGIDGDIKSNEQILKNIRELFYKNVDFYLEQMVNAANGVSKALSLSPVPFLSIFMGGLDSGYDMRDTTHQGTKYNGSGCLIHGLSVIADSFIAIDEFLKQDKYTSDELIDALKQDFKGHEELHIFLKSAPKFGNNISSVDEEARLIAEKISQMIKNKKNYLGNAFRVDFSSPSTHLTYGYHVGATPDGRHAREMLGYGIDPLYGEATSGLGFRMLSTYKLPFIEFNGGYASHLGVDPKYFITKTHSSKGIEFRDKIIKTVFFSSEEKVNPFYLYVNVTTAETLRAVLKNPKKYAPNGVYIMRIHGTFVNFLDLSSAIQEDIIKRLDNNSSQLS